jgi:hypothetical protein
MTSASERSDSSASPENHQSGVDRLLDELGIDRLQWNSRRAFDPESHRIPQPRLVDGPKLVQKAGADYTFYQVDYEVDSRVLASRYMAVILAGKRTEVAYWAKAAPTKELDILRGRGNLLLGKNPDDGKIQSWRLNDPNDLDAEPPIVTLPGGHFYTLEAHHYADEPLIVAGFYDGPVDWDNWEVSVRPGSQSIEVPGEGTVPVPKIFQFL